MKLIPYTGSTSLETFLTKFRQHLLGRPITVRTDHAAFTYLMKTPEPVGQQGRWLDLIGEFDLAIQHRPGRVHSNSDALSRRPCRRDPEVDCPQCDWGDDWMSVQDEPTNDRIFPPDPPCRTAASGGDPEGAVAYVSLDSDRNDSSSDSDAVGNKKLFFTLDRIREAQRADPDIDLVIRSCEEGTLPAPEDIRQMPTEAKALLNQWESLTGRHGVLYRRFYYPDGTVQYLQVVLPGSLRRQYVERLHAELGHFGQAKTSLAFARRAYFPSCQSYVHTVVKCCTVCNQSRRSRQAP